EYQRNGVANLFMIFAPLEGWRPRGSDRPPRRRRLRESPQKIYPTCISLPPKKSCCSRTI
ncbi:MAG TPA: hypothetical protein VFE63_21205, partial [Roseiarcus sp.]|nr:hypothetical protein [Roseiarcus sp.]